MIQTCDVPLSSEMYLRADELLLWMACFTALMAHAALLGEKKRPRSCSESMHNTGEMQQDMPDQQQVKFIRTCDIALSPAYNRKLVHGMHQRKHARAALKLK